MIYTDGQHVVADSEKELHEWIKRVLGFKREWYHDRYLRGPRKGQLNSHPHYDVLATSKLAIMKKHSIKETDKEFSISGYHPIKINEQTNHVPSTLGMMKSCSNVLYVSKKELVRRSRSMIKNG